MRRFSNSPTHLVWHCSASDVPEQCSFQAIWKLHTSPKNRGFDWGEYKTAGKGFSDIGYHAVIEKSGVVVMGRSFLLMGAHALGFNDKSIGVCMVGNKDFTVEQFISARLLTATIVRMYPTIKRPNIIGHYNVSDKTCPNFDVEEEIVNSEVLKFLKPF
jgi:hypothetical protein